MQEDERKLQPGEVVALPASLLAVEKRKPDQTVWIRADREGELKQKTLPQVRGFIIFLISTNLK